MRPAQAPLTQPSFRTEGWRSRQVPNPQLKDAQLNPLAWEMGANHNLPEEGSINPCMESAIPMLSSQENHRIVKSLRLDKTSKSIKSNRHPNTTVPAKPCPEVPYLGVF